MDATETSAKEPESTNVEDSSDDEMDFTAVNNAIGTGEKRFYFYEFGVHPVPFQDVLDDLTKLRTKYNLTGTLNKTRTKKLTSKDYDSDEDDVNHVHVSNKTFSIKDFQTKQFSKKNDATLARFHRYPSPWDSSFEPSPTLKKQLYRTPVCDPSGRQINNVERDLAKGVTPWKAVEVDRLLPPTTFDSCSDTLQAQVVRHIDEVIAKVEKEYASAPQKTQAQSNLKADIGADLNNLYRKRELIREELARSAANTGSAPPSRQAAHKKHK